MDQIELKVTKREIDLEVAAGNHCTKVHFVQLNAQRVGEK